MLKIGAELSKAQERLANHGNGTFGKWCKERLGISSQSARNAINAFHAFGQEDCKTVLQSFDASALYLLSADSTPEEATEKAWELAEAGETITKKRAKQIVDEVCSEGRDAPPAIEETWLDKLSSIESQLRRLARSIEDHERREMFREELERLRQEIDDILSGELE